MDLITQRLKLKDAFPNFSDIARRYGVDRDKAEFIRKGYTPTEIKFVDGEKAVVSYINTAAIDRDAEVTLPEGGIMDAYRENPVVMFGHDYKTLPVGKCDSLKLDSKGWQAKTVYANTDKATEIYEYRRAGFPLAESIGFIPIESISQGEAGFDELAKDLVKRGAFKRGDISKIRRIHSKWAMLEYSDVPIPSNPEALQVAIAKGLILPETLIDDIVNAPIVDLTGEPKELVTKPEDTGEFIRIPVDSGNHEGHRIRNIDISQKEGISALYCGTDKVIMTYLFRKDKGWDMAKARAWVKEHEKSVIISTTSNSVNDDEVITAVIQPDEVILNSPRAAKTSQDEIRDELDYVLSIIKAWDINEDNQAIVKSIHDELVKRFPGNDIPVEIKTKEESLTSSDILEAIKRISTK